MRFGTAVVDDTAASGGKALRIPYQAGANGWSVVFSAPRMEMRGQVQFTFWLRAENLPPLTPGFMLTLVAHDKPPKGVTPVMYLDKTQIAVPVFDTPRVLEVTPAKIHYQPQEKVTVHASLVNPTPAAIEGVLLGEEIRAADTTRLVFQEKVRLAAGEQKQVTFSYVLGSAGADEPNPLRTESDSDGSAVQRTDAG
jgi:hypothetical protein